MGSILTFSYNSTDYYLECPDVPLVEYNQDDAIRSKTVDGYLVARARYTKPTKVFEVNYSYLSSTDKNTIQDLEDLVHVYTSFTWYHPISSTSYTVYFDEPIKYANVKGNLWNVSFKLIGVVTDE